MGLPISQLVIATNENDILHRFWQTGAYEKLLSVQLKEYNPPADGVKETMSPAMDILISSNFERLLWFLAYDVYGFGVEDLQNKRQAGRSRNGRLKSRPGSQLSKRFSMLQGPSSHLSGFRMRRHWLPFVMYTSGSVLDPHSAVSVTAAVRLDKASPRFHYVALSTAHPAKFSHAVEKALSREKGFNFKEILPSQLSELDGLPRRVVHVQRKDGLDGIRKIIKEQVEKESGTKVASSEDSLAHQDLFCATYLTTLRRKPHDQPLA